MIYIVFHCLHDTWCPFVHATVPHPSSTGAGAVFQGGLFGVAGMFPEKYMTAVVAGQALGGVFASGARIVSLSVGAQDANSAFIYFMIAVIVMIFTLLAYLYMSKTVSAIIFLFFVKMVSAV